MKAPQRSVKRVKLSAKWPVEYKRFHIKVAKDHLHMSFLPTKSKHLPRIKSLISEAALKSLKQNQRLDSFGFTADSEQTSFMLLRFCGNMY